MPAGMLETRNEKAAREAVKKELQKRRETITLALNYYEGKQKPHLKKLDANVVDNVCCEVIDGTASFLLPDMPEIVIADDPDATAWLREVWEHNGGAALLLDMATNGGIAGHVYARVAAPDGDDYPVIRGVDARNWATWYAEDDYKKRLGYESQWGKMEHAAPVTKYRQDIVPDGPGRWLIIDYMRGGGDAWTVSNEAAWDYPLAPMVDWQHLPKAGYQYYGQTETPQHLLTMQDKINAITTDINQIIRYHAYPTTVATGVDDMDDEEDASIDAIITFRNPDARVYNVEMDSDLVASRAERDAAKASFFAKARVVKLPGTLDAFKGVTNLGIRTLYLPQSSKAKTLRRHYGYGIREISKRLLMLAGRNYENVQIDVEWGSALPTDERETLQIIQTEVGLGIMSRQQAAEKRGRDIEAVRQQILADMRFEDLQNTGGVMFGDVR